MQCGTHATVILNGTCDKEACCTCIPACTALTGTSLGGTSLGGGAMMLTLGPLEKSLSRKSGPGAGASLGPGAGRGGCGNSVRAIVAQSSLSILKKALPSHPVIHDLLAGVPSQLGSGSWTGARLGRTPQQQAMLCSRSAASKTCLESTHSSVLCASRQAHQLAKDFYKVIRTRGRCKK